MVGRVLASARQSESWRDASFIPGLYLDGIRHWLFDDHDDHTRAFISHTDRKHGDKNGLPSLPVIIKLCRFARRSPRWPLTKGTLMSARRTGSEVAARALADHTAGLDRGIESTTIG